jgi:hypothetical protein
MNIQLDNNRFFTITFYKKDGELRTINGRLGVKKHLKGGVSTLDANKFLTVYSIADKGYRAINKAAIVSIKQDNILIYNLGV